MSNSCECCERRKVFNKRASSALLCVMVVIAAIMTVIHLKDFNTVKNAVIENRKAIMSLAYDLEKVKKKQSASSI